MKRDFKLIKKILEELEKSESSGIVGLEIKGYTADQIRCQCQILKHGGYVASYDDSWSYDYDTKSSSYRVGNITWDGYNLLEKIRELESKGEEITWLS